MAALGPGLGLLLDVALPYGLWSGVVVALLAWSAMSAGGARAYAALGLLAVLLVTDVHRHAAGNEAITLVTLVFAGVIGHVWAGRAGAERAAHSTAARLRAEHDAATELALRAEQLRVARELHDVTSHAVGVMVLQAGAAVALREQDPERAREAVGLIRSTGTEALAQLEELLQLLDEGAVGAAGVASSAPAEDLGGALESLAARMRAAGLQVRLALTGVPVEPGLRATIHRIVQESLTNVMRHAPGSRVDVAVRETAGGWEVAVRDDGPAGVPAVALTGGFGLVGLAERVEALGGEFSAGPDRAGGFALRAFLPIDRPVESRS